MHDIRRYMTIVTEAASVRVSEDQPGEPVKLYHITSKANFRLNPNYAPKDNAVSMDDRSGIKGIYLARDVERWVNGHGYARAFVAEIFADPLVIDQDRVGRWGGEVFVPADQFDKLKINRVVPLDVIAREEFGVHGWIERSHGHEFDSGNKIMAEPWEYPFRDNYKYDKDVRDMAPDEIAMIKQHFKIGNKARLKG